MNITNIEGLARLEADLNRLPQAFAIIHARYSHALAGGWKRWILGESAVDTGRYLFSVAAHSMAGAADAATFVIDTSNESAVTYSDIVERGRKDTPKYPVRYPAGKSLEAQHHGDLPEQVTTQTLDQFLHG